MLKLYQYIFFSAYSFCIKIYKEKEFPEYFACGVLSLVLGTNILLILEFIEYLILPYKLNIHYKYHGIFGLFLWGLLTILMLRKKKYKSIINNFTSMRKASIMKLKYISIAYITILVVLYYYIGFLLKESNPIA
jgi:hypothetical protein